MEELIMARQGIINFYRRGEFILAPLLKLFVSFFIFFFMKALAFGSIGLFKAAGIALIGAMITLFLSGEGFLFLASIVAFVYLSYASIETAVIVFLVLLLIILFLAKLFPKECLIIPAILLGYYLKVPYAGVIFAAVYLSPAAIIPASAAAFLNYMSGHLKDFVKIAPRSEFTSADMLDGFLNVYGAAYEAASKDSSWVALAVVFIISILLGCIIRFIDIDRKKDWAAAAAALSVGIITLVISFLGIYPESIFIIITGSIGGYLIVKIIMFFDIALDYPHCEKVEFEDSENYYYVKVVPKVIEDNEYYDDDL